MAVRPEPFHLYMVGIGGTGVVTVNQVLATAAALAGRHVLGLDQTGLSQKAGPVVSHLKISAWPIEGDNRVMTGQADLLLGLDILVATDPRHLGRASRDRTVAVVCTGQVPTGRMVSDPTAPLPELGAMQGDLEAHTRPDGSVYLDSIGVAEALFGDHMAANMVMVGAAYQAIADLPETIRGYEEIKLAAAQQFRAEASALLHRLEQLGSGPAGRSLNIVRGVVS